MLKDSQDPHCQGAFLRSKVHKPILDTDPKKCFSVCVLIMTNETEIIRVDKLRV